MWFNTYFYSHSTKVKFIIIEIRVLFIVIIFMIYCYFDFDFANTITKMTKNVIKVIALNYLAIDIYYCNLNSNH